MEQHKEGIQEEWTQKSREEYEQWSEEQKKKRNYSGTDEQGQDANHWYGQWRGQADFYPVEAVEWTEQEKLNYERSKREEAIQRADEYFLEQPHHHQAFEWIYGKNNLGEEYYSLEVENEQLSFLEVDQANLRHQLTAKQIGVREETINRQYNNVTQALDDGENLATDYLAIKQRIVERHQSIQKNAQDKQLPDRIISF